MRTEDLFPLWCWIADLEQAGRISGIEATMAKLQIYRVMQERGLEPDEVVAQAQTAALRGASGNCQSSASGLPKPIVSLDF